MFYMREELIKNTEQVILWRESNCFFLLLKFLQFWNTKEFCLKILISFGMFFDSIHLKLLKTIS